MIKIKDDHLQLKKHDRKIWSVTLSNPEKRNALSYEVVEGIITIIDSAHKNNIRILVLKGTGRSFCSGFDLSNINNIDNKELLWRFIRLEQMLQMLTYSSFHTVVYAQGPIVGAGADLVVSCKYRIVDPSASFLFPGLQFGLILGTRRLANLIGMDNARDILVKSRLVEAEEAKRIGLITEVINQNKWSIEENILAADRVKLSVESMFNLYRITEMSTAHQDMYELVESITKGNLKNRIKEYIKK